MWKLIAASSIPLLLVACPLRAADDTSASTGAPTRLTITLPPAVSETEERPVILPVLYAGLVGLQAYDVYATHAGIARGAAELNPLVAPMASDTAGMIVIKALGTGTTIAMAEGLWRHNKTAAILTMVAANGVMAIVAANNTRVLHQAR